MLELRNTTTLDFTDISTELFREYTTPYGSLKIHGPAYLAVSDNGHRVLDQNGISYYIDTRKGFFLSWKARDGQPHFVK